MFAERRDALRSSSRGPFFHGDERSRGNVGEAGESKYEDLVRDLYTGRTELNQPRRSSYTLATPAKVVFVYIYLLHRRRRFRKVIQPWYRFCGQKTRRKWAYLDRLEHLTVRRLPNSTSRLRFRKDSSTTYLRRRRIDARIQ